MRITCIQTAKGNVYRFFRDNERFYHELRPLVAPLMACDGDLQVGEDEVSDAQLMLCVGLRNGQAEAEFRRLAARYLDAGCKLTKDIAPSSR